MKISEQQIHLFQEKVLSFYEKHGRDLPWRKTTNPYKILLSEVMLQQTQVSRVIEYYTQWIARWPTIESLAEASRKDVLQAWMGLGYNRRAVHVHQAAHAIAKTFDGDVLQAMDHFDEVPGIGPYTSQAVRIFASNADIVTVDTNIRRILIHEFSLPEGLSSKALWSLAERCLPKGRSCEWHNALMDYGALLMTSRKTGIRPLTTQSRFEGSDRQIRGMILRSLLQHPSSLAELKKKINVKTSRLKTILDKMLHEGLISVHDNEYVIKE